MGGPGVVKYPEIIIKISKDTNAFHLVTSVCRAMVRAGVDRRIVAEAANAMTAETVSAEEYLEKARAWVTVTLIDDQTVPPKGNAKHYAELVNDVFGVIKETSAVD